MSCLLKFNWVKLPRDTLPPGKGLMGAWARLATRAAFRPGQSNYCGHRNDVELALWVWGYCWFEEHSRCQQSPESSGDHERPN